MAPGEDFDQTGFELPPAPKAPAEAKGQGQLFDDDSSQSDSADVDNTGTVFLQQRKTPGERQFVLSSTFDF